MKCRVVVSFMLDEDDADMAEIELESQLSDLINQTRNTTVQGFEVVESQEIEEEEDDE